MPNASLMLCATLCLGQTSLPPIPEAARLVIDEDWSSGRIDPQKWYVLRKQWGVGNHGVVPENVRDRAGLGTRPPTERAGLHGPR